jgi:hypothetical protein
MTNLHGIATCTAALRARMAEVLPTAVAGATATAVRVGETAGQNGLPQLGANVFLTATRRAPAHANTGAPSRDASGRLLNRPGAAVELDYLLSFYGPDMMAVQRLMGAAIISLHARPALTPAMIAAAEAGLPPSGLADQRERVRMTPVELSLEENSKLWSTLLGTKYVPSIAVRLGPLLLEAPLAPEPSLPVRGFDAPAVPLRPPVLESVEPDAGDAIEPGARLVLRGRFDPTRPLTILLGEAVLAPLPPLRRDRLEVDLPADALPGPIAAAVREDIVMGAPPLPHPGIASEGVPVLVRPAIADAVLDQVSGGALRDARLTLRLSAAVPAGTEAVVHLRAAGSDGARLFRAASLEAASDTLRIALTAVPPGAHDVRVAVRAALSRPRAVVVP